jgi:hypothetical protein
VWRTIGSERGSPLQPDRVINSAVNGRPRTWHLRASWLRRVDVLVRAEAATGVASSRTGSVGRGSPATREGRCLSPHCATHSRFRRSVGLIKVKRRAAPQQYARRGEEYHPIARCSRPDSRRGSTTQRFCVELRREVNRRSRGSIGRGCVERRGDRGRGIDDDQVARLEERCRGGQMCSRSSAAALLRVRQGVRTPSRLQPVRLRRLCMLPALRREARNRTDLWPTWWPSHGTTLLPRYRPLGAPEARRRRIDGTTDSGSGRSEMSSPGKASWCISVRMSPGSTAYTFTSGLLDHQESGATGQARPSTSRSRPILHTVRSAASEEIASTMPRERREAGPQLPGTVPGER